MSAEPRPQVGTPGDRGPVTQPDKVWLTECPLLGFLARFQLTLGRHGPRHPLGGRGGQCVAAVHPRPRFPPRNENRVAPKCFAKTPCGFGLELWCAAGPLISLLPVSVSPPETQGQQRHRKHKVMTK